jgi:molybdate transport system substrate-binding protein
MDAVAAAGRVEPASVALFACNRLVVVASGDRVAALSDLAAPGVKLVIGAEAVPVGAYSLAFLDAAATDPAYGEPFRAGVLGNVVSYEQSVRAVLSKVRLGEADAGIVYATDAQAAARTTASRTTASADVTVIEIPAHLNQLAYYQVAPLRDAIAPEMTREFFSFLLSSEGKSTLTQAGFSTDCASATPE